VKSGHQVALLRQAAERASSRPEFLAQVLALYQEIEGMTESHLREQLGITEANWPRLQLCLRPRTDSFLKDVTQIAKAFGIDRATLASIIRRVDAVGSYQKREQPGHSGTLLAARTRKRKQRPGNSEASND
jgi:hypothetical protein